MIRTSDSDPIRVDFVPQEAHGLPGRLGLTFAPGKCGKGAYAIWDRDLAQDSLREPLTDERFYFLMADRFANGSTANDRGGLPGGRLETGLGLGAATARSPQTRRPGGRPPAGPPSSHLPLGRRCPQNDPPAEPAASRTGAPRSGRGTHPR